MRDFATFRKSAIRYWEKRRLFYNLMLVLPALVGYFTATEFPIAVGDRSYLGLLGIGVLFLLAALAANVCYSMCYSLEFVFGSDESNSAWLRFGRRLALISGIIFAMLLSVVGGRNIGLLEYQMRRASVNPAEANSAIGVLGQIDPAKAGDLGDVFINDGITNSLPLGSALIYGHLYTGSNSPVILGANGGVGTHAWLATNSGIEPGYRLESVSFAVPDTSPPYSNGLVPGPGDVALPSWTTNHYDHILNEGFRR